jgi:hypothetical protein
MAIYGPSSQPTSISDNPLTVNASTTSIPIGAVNQNRSPESYIVNNSNKIMWVSWGITPALAAAPFTPVPANGGAIDVPGNFVGQIYAIWAAGATGSCVFHEFTNQ